MNRRTALRLTLAVPAVAIAGFHIEAVRAQLESVTTEMIGARPWLEPPVFINLRRLAAALIDLRIVYNGPNGYEADAPFADNVFNIWRDALASPGGEEELLSKINEVKNRLDAGLAEDLESQMNNLLEQNGDTFIEWLQAIGVQSGSQLQQDFLRSQAMFAIFAAALLGDGKLSTFEGFTWVFPFC